MEVLEEEDFFMSSRRAKPDHVNTLMRFGMHDRNCNGGKKMTRTFIIIELRKGCVPFIPANQALYPQPRSQKPGLGFPLCWMVGIVCLGSGAVLNAATGQYRGKGGDEQSLLRSILDTPSFSTTLSPKALEMSRQDISGAPGSGGLSSPPSSSGEEE